ncbi:MAG TPA: ATP-binding protein [Streptomyces sp.]|nr:ATP-binding protein [Streptomyces sp.]
MHVRSDSASATTGVGAPRPEGDGPVCELTAAVVTELRLSAFRALRDRTVPLAPVTLLTGRSGSGKSSVLEAYEALARLGGGEALGEVFGRAAGGARAYVPHSARPDGEGRRGFQLGCTVDGPAGPVRFDLAVQAEPGLRIVGERLSTPDGRTLLATALRDPSRPAVQAEWHSAGAGRVTRARLPDDRLATALLPLRVAGSSDEECRVLTAAEQVVIALRSVFACDPRPENMRDPVSAADTLLRGGCDNVAAVLRRTRMECGIRHGLLLEALRAGCAGPVADLATDVVDDGRDRGLMRALVVRGEERGRTPLEWLGDGELRYAALALVLLTGPGVLSMDPVQEVLPARQALTVLADGLDSGLDGRQARELLALALRMGERGHVRLLGAVSDEGPAAREAVRAVRAVTGEAEPAPGVSLVDLGA